MPSIDADDHTTPTGAGQPRPPADDVVHEATLPDTLISLIVAFVIAMSFRGFVVEGFVIPTGSMAPTLLGEHVLWQSPRTGYTWTTDASAKTVGNPDASYNVPDPMLGPDSSVFRVSGADIRAMARPGDRVLVLKWLYNFVDPNRFDVIVFKNPTNSRENYIKRLIGLPNEATWLADGDVFARPVDTSDALFTVQRKPEHVQRAVWQPVYDSSWAPMSDATAESAFQPPWGGEGWDTAGSTFRCESELPTTLTWNSRLRSLHTWNPYNTFFVEDASLWYSVSDLCFAAGVHPQQAGLQTTLRLTARAHDFEFSLADGRATVRMRPVDAEAWEAVASAEFDGFPAGRTTNIEFWHVDQRLAVFVNDVEVVSLAYEWDPYKRLAVATGAPVEHALDLVPHRNPWVSRFRPSEPTVSWDFDGSAVALHRVRIDRDLYYQPDELRDRRSPAIGTHPEALAVTGPDQFFMLGDNSAHSSDGRLWGEPDELVEAQIDPTPYLVHRSLIVGKAWAVYFPAPFALKTGGARIVPDFGRIRFIR